MALNVKYYTVVVVVVVVPVLDLIFWRFALLFFLYLIPSLVFCVLILKKQGKIENFTDLFYLPLTIQNLNKVSKIISEQISVTDSLCQQIRKHELNLAVSTI